MGLRKRDAATRNLLGKGILEAYKVGSLNVHVVLEHLNNQGNLRDLVKDEVYHCPSLRKPQAYEVDKDPVDGEVMMQVRRVGCDQQVCLSGRVPVM